MLAARHRLKCPGGLGYATAMTVADLNHSLLTASGVVPDRQSALNLGRQEFVDQPSLPGPFKQIEQKTTGDRQPSPAFAPRLQMREKFLDFL